MEVNIVSKLNHELGREIVSEGQVVYILVEARKLLEQRKVLRNFKALKLCSDWAVHPKLNGPDSQDILRYFDAYEAEFRNSGLTMPEFRLDPLHDFMSHKKFRAEFIEALSPYEVDVEYLASDSFWRPFIQHYTSVIQDCPLEAIGNSTQLVSRVSCLAWPKEMADGIFPGRRVVQWNWTLKENDERKLVCSLV